MSSDACREFYPEEKVLIAFLKKHLPKEIFDYEHTFTEDEAKLRDEIRDLIGQMEQEGARPILDEKNREIRDLKKTVRNLCAKIPVTELLTHDNPYMREIGKEFKEIMDYHYKTDPDLPEGLTTAKEFYDHYIAEKAAVNG